MPIIEQRKWEQGATVSVALEGDHRFTFDVGDWDTDEKPLTDEQAWGLANELLRKDRVILEGKLDGQWTATIIDPDRIVAIGVRPTQEEA